MILSTTTIHWAATCGEILVLMVVVEIVVVLVLVFSNSSSSTMIRMSKNIR